MEASTHARSKLPNSCNALLLETVPLANPLASLSKPHFLEAASSSRLTTSLVTSSSLYNHRYGVLSLRN
jgi:hypothetical protein